MEIEDKKEQIEEIMNNFDFVKVQRVMEFLNWTYADSEISPSVDELIETAKSSLNNLGVKSKEGICVASGTGGFSAVIKRCSLTGNSEMKLTFEIEECGAL